jgi:antagonist of KipI
LKEKQVILLKKGILSSYKSLGNNGLRHLGINPSGAMDKLTVRLLNILLQNNEDESALEMHFPAPEILFEEDCMIAIGGADFKPMLNNQPITNWKTVNVKEGSILKFQKRLSGNRAYLSKKTGNNGKFLPYLGNTFVRQFSNLLDYIEIRFIAGNEFNLLTEDSKQNLENQSFTITQKSNRMGFRMESEELELTKKIELVSSAVDFGTIQLLPNGQIIILMADHQTSGGYPRIGNVISVDLPILAQCGANDKIKLKAISIEEAEDLIISQEKEIQKLKASIRLLSQIS